MEEISFVFLFSIPSAPAHKQSFGSSSTNSSGNENSQEPKTLKEGIFSDQSSYGLLRVKWNHIAFSAFSLFDKCLPRITHAHPIFPQSLTPRVKAFHTGEFWVWSIRSNTAFQIGSSREPVVSSNNSSLRTRHWMSSSLFSRLLVFTTNICCFLRVLIKLKAGDGTRAS